MKRSKKIKSLLKAFFFLWAFGLLDPSALVRAEDSSKALTRESIENFINETTDISQGGTNRSPEDIQAYLDRHLDDDVRFKSTVTYTMPGIPAQKASMVMKKQDYMDNIKKGAQTLKEYHSDVSIRDVKIASNGRKATVFTESQENGVMPVTPEGGGGPQDVPVIGKSSCNQILSLTDKGVIQIYSAICTTDIQFAE